MTVPAANREGNAPLIARTGGSRAPIPEPVRQNLRRNYTAHSLEGGCFMGGMAFVAPETILPPFMEELGAPALLIALCPQLMFIGFVIPPLLMAHRVESLERLKPWVLRWTIFQRLPFLAAGLILLLTAHLPNGLLLAAVALAPFFSGLAGGMSVAAWSALVAKVIPANRRASASAIRHSIGAGMGVGAGLLADYVLSAFDRAEAYALLHLICFAVLMIGFGLFSRIREPDIASPPRPKRSLRQSLAGMVPILKQDVRFRTYLLSRCFLAGIYVVAPFLSIHAIATLEQDRSFSGVLTSYKSLGILLGNIAGAILGDRLGGKIVMVLAVSSLLAMTALSLVAGSVWSFYLLFVLWGAGFSLQVVGHQTLQLELAPPDRVPTYVSLQMASALPFMLTAGVLSTVFRGVSERQFDAAIWPLAVPTLLCLALSMVFLLPVREPRKEG
ncbi:MAG: MFS transporter [Opitutales bacterium]